MTDPITSMLELLVDEPGDELARLLFELRWLVLKHPLAAQAAVRTLVAEGRQFGETDDGRAWRARLEHSELARRGASIVELGTLGMIDGDSDAALPTQLIDAFARAASRRDLEEALARRLEPEVEG
ncbi:MAG: hypothetical protein ABI678_30570 [Kofleriaceae bacterium]